MAEYIDREAVIHELLCNSVVQFVDTKVLSSVVGKINLIPSADVVEVRHGEWSENDLSVWADCPKDGFPVAICSVCGIRLCDIINNIGYMYNYCPNCGAKMDGK